MLSEDNTGTKLKKGMVIPMAQQYPLTYTLQLRLKKEETFFGPGVAELLQLVDETHSLNMAAERMGMAYSKAWKVMGNAERQLGYPLTIRRMGGVGGGGSELTPEGRLLLTCFLRFEQEAYKLADRLFEEIFEQEAVR